MSDEKKYRCELCGAESDQADECCGQPMNKISDNDSCGCGCDEDEDEDEDED